MKNWLNQSDLLIKSGNCSTFVVAIEEAFHVAVLWLDSGAKSIRRLSIFTHHVFVISVVHRRLLTTVGINILSERMKCLRLCRKSLINVQFTSMSTWTTPVDLRFGRRRRWIIACVVWPPRLSFSLSFSVEFISFIEMWDRPGSRAFFVSPLSSSDRFVVADVSFSVEFCRLGAAVMIVVLSGSWVVPFVGEVGGCVVFPEAVAGVDSSIFD